MKTYAPRHLHGADLPQLMADLHATRADVCKYLQVCERTLRGWLSNGSAPYSALAALWHETPAGREAAHLDVGNELVVQRGLSRSTGEALARETAKLSRLLAICDTGAANDPLMTGPGGGNGGHKRPDPARVVPTESAPIRRAAAQ